jgi:hypothetical protein
MIAGVPAFSEYSKFKAECPAGGPPILPKCYRDRRELPLAEVAGRAERSSITRVWTKRTAAWRERPVSAWQGRPCRDLSTPSQSQGSFVVGRDDTGRGCLAPTQSSSGPLHCHRVLLLESPSTSSGSLVVGGDDKGLGCRLTARLEPQRAKRPACWGPLKGSALIGT